MFTLLWGEYNKSKLLRFLFKPLTILLILFIPIMSTQLSWGINYSSLIITGLFLSMFGDIFLMFSEKYFVPGLIAFLMAHLVYTSAFISVDGIHYSWICFIFLIGGILIFRMLNKNLGKLQMPVAIYISAIAIMAWQSWELYLLTESYGFELAAVGTIFFLISDLALSVNKFLKPMKFAQFIILPTYFIAQWLIAISTLF
ncbi:MAG: lysoplasmalogenase [Candidatus Marinimicrobia bacterium]|nr:lysoplasmalogenase [Candidatus Neomarinimicrobiota bacterium]